MTLTDWQIVASIVASTVTPAVVATYFITRKITGVEKDVLKTNSEVDDLNEKFKRVEDDLRYWFRLNLEESRKDAADLRSRKEERQEEKKKD